MSGPKRFSPKSHAFRPNPLELFTFYWNSFFPKKWPALAAAYLIEIPGG
jgi:hypothetical protein